MINLNEKESDTGDRHNERVKFKIEFDKRSVSGKTRVKITFSRRTIYAYHRVRTSSRQDQFRFRLINYTTNNYRYSKWYLLQVFGQKCKVNIPSFENPN